MYADDEYSSENVESSDEEFVNEFQDAEDPIAAIENLASESEQENRAMAEIDARFYKATLYKDLLQSPLFGNADEISAEVKHECDAFFRRRLHETMAGVNKSGEGTLLTDKRIAVLAMLADVVATNPKLRAAFGIKDIGDSSAPAEETRTAPPRPQVLMRPNPAAEPSRRPSIGVKQPTMSRVAPKPKGMPNPLQKHVMAPKAPAPAVAQPILDENGDPKPTGVPRQASNPVKPQKMVKQSFVHPDGDRITYKSRIYKVNHRELEDPRQFGPKYVNAINDLDEGESIVLGNGMQVGRTKHGLVKVILSDVTPMRPSEKSVPFPTSAAQMEWATAAQANETLDKIDGNTQKILSKL